MLCFKSNCVPFVHVVQDSPSQTNVTNWIFLSSAEPKHYGFFLNPQKLYIYIYKGTAKI